MHSLKKSNCYEILKLYESYQNFLDDSYTASMCLSDKSNKFNSYYNHLILKECKKIKKKYSHGSLWGYKKGPDLYRYFDMGTAFGTYGYHKVIAQNNLIIYSKYESGGYRAASQTYYFYSISLNSPLKKLNIENLEIDYPNSSFVDELKGLENLTEKDNNSNLKIDVIFDKYFNSKKL